MAGYSVVHWSAVGDTAAPDPEIMKYARAHEYVILTRDLDFGILLSAGGIGRPSVVQIRTINGLASMVASLVIAAINAHVQSLEDGALLTITERKARIKALPFAIKHQTGR